jgi:hypothetical protein
MAWSSQVTQSPAVRRGAPRSRLRSSTSITPVIARCRQPARRSAILFGCHISRSLQRSPHDIETLSTIFAFDNLPAQRFIEAGDGTRCIQINGWMTQFDRMRFDGSDEPRTKAAASMIGSYEQCSVIGPVSWPVVGFGFVQGNRPRHFSARNGNERDWKSFLTEMAGQPVLNRLKRRIRIRPPLAMNPCRNGWQMLQLVA